MRTYHRQADSGVATGCFDYGLPGFESTAALGILYDTQGQAILDRAHRVERFDFDVDIDILWSQVIDPDHGRIADRLENALM